MTSSQHLEAFLAVLRTGSITSAAKVLNLSPSAVSQQIAALEADLGAPLFIRHARRIEPAPTAGVVADQARKVLSQLETMKRQAAHPAEGAVLTIGLFASLAQRIVGPLQAGLTGRGITARYVVADPPMIGHELLTAQPGTAGIDVGIVFHIGAGQPAVTGAFQREWLEDEPFDVVLPRAWGVPKGTSGVDLARLGWIVHHPGTADATIMERALEVDAEAPRIVGRSDDFLSSLELVRAGIGAALIPRSVLAGASLDGVEIRPGTDIRLVRGVFALSHRQSPVAGQVQAAVEEIRTAVTATARRAIRP